MKLSEAIQHFEESLTDQSHDWDCEECKAEHEQLLEWLKENVELKKLLKLAVNDIGRMSRDCSGFNCDHCPHIRTIDKGYQYCVWQHMDEAMKLIGDENNEKTESPDSL